MCIRDSRYGERGAADAKPKAQIILDAAKVSAASGGNSEPKQGPRSQSARGFCPRRDVYKRQVQQDAEALSPAGRSCAAARELYCWRMTWQNTSRTMVEPDSTPASTAPTLAAVQQLQASRVLPADVYKRQYCNT